MHHLTQTRLKAGDLVRLKSGGPVMTAAHVAYDRVEPYARCFWFDASEQPHTVHIKIPALVRASEADQRS